MAEFVLHNYTVTLNMSVELLITKSMVLTEFFSFGAIPRMIYSIPLYPLSARRLHVSANYAENKSWSEILISSVVIFKFP